ncbi:SacI homology domain-containing protein [Irpex rosettiformis]|uniref:SacI homology domain-containing protein n=1 Tax=Irpex rosettiformis TaxID=378272 RepID=A0ACB8UGP0_9APHY|nr:SacI homology domain-containing protein [Irpex rosettiformis]
MKKIFAKPFKFPPIRSNSTSSSSNPAPTTYHPIPTTNTVHTTSLQPKFIVPPTPHPYPYEYIVILAAPQGLLLRQFLRDGTHPESHVCISWGKEGAVEEIQNSSEVGDLDWNDGVIVYGLVGILNLYTGSHLLVINHRSDMGSLLDPIQTVYEVKGVAPIPLTEAGARNALKALATRNNAQARLSLIPTHTVTSASIDGALASSTRSSIDNDSGPIPRVTFASEDQVKIMTPTPSQRFDLEDDTQSRSPSPSPASSIISTPSSELSVNTGNLAKTLADRLSFWNKFPRRIPTPQPTSIAQTLDQDNESAEGTEIQQHHERLSLDEIVEQGDKEPSEVLDTLLSSASPIPTTMDQKNSELEEKVIRECVHQFSKGMYFSYHFDITRSLQHKQALIAKMKKQKELLVQLNAIDSTAEVGPSDDKISVLEDPSSTLPLWRRVDRQFWWNEWLSKPFIDAGLHSYVLPIMQGFFQIATFGIPREPEATEDGDAALVDYVLISRRSRDRAGLRYQRRGIDDDANVANFVETETIMRVEREGFQNVFSHVQIRGSIPLFWSQPGYSLKPAPVLSPERSQAQNLDALKRHMQRLIPRYGPLILVNLAEQHGKEGVLTTAYRDSVSEVALEDARYIDYDFHIETKGMKYENIMTLIDQLQRAFESQGYLWISNDLIMSQQKGVFRVNCIDCLDRTNVMESAFARHVLNRQLGSVALQYPSGAGKVETDVVFNDVWANNGDAISREYAGTSALKGDFTRTGKRDLTGMLNDGVNSLARMYTSTFGDWFSQAVIDFMLGNRTTSVFSEFLNKLQSSDPRDLIRLSKIRAEAIAECVSRVLSEGESLLSGWTLFAPAEVNVKMSDKFEEKVLLLSVRALYIISYDYNLEKVKMYIRVPLGDVEEITKGAYILSPLEEGSRDPLQNAGFTVAWRNNHQDTRVTSYSIGNSVDTISPPVSPGLPRSSHSSFSPLIPLSPSRQSTLKNAKLSRILSSAAAPSLNNDITFAAFKALPIDPARGRRENGSFYEPADELTGAIDCRQAVNLMVDAIARACADAGGARGENFVKSADVVSLQEAQRMTSVYAKMEYGVKRLLWLGG